MGLMSVAEAARFLGVSEETVKRRIRRGELSGEQRPRPQGYAWMVDIPEDLHATTTHHDMTTGHDNTFTTQHHVTDHNTGNGSSMREVKRLDQIVTILESQMALNQEELESRRREVQEPQSPWIASGCRWYHPHRWRGDSRFFSL